MSVDNDTLTPQQRLARSRQELVDMLQGSERRRVEGETETGVSAERPAPRGSAFDRIAWTQVTRQVLQRWWRRHPANAAAQLARPLLERYARQQPAKLVAAAAGAGALMVLVKPWRLLSVTAIIAALLKTSDVADLVTTLMHKTPNTPRKDPP